MLKLVRPLFILSAAMLLLVACTRERPTPEPTATAAVGANAPAAAAPDTQTTTDTTTTTDTAQAGSEVGIVITTTPGPLTPSPVLTPTRTTPETFSYTVQAGDTLGSLAMRFETDIETLRQLNNLQGDNLTVGQIIYVPFVEGMTAEGVPTPTPGPFLYTIQVGDTLSGLALRFGVDSIAIVEANRDTLLDPDNLTIGATILIPGYQPPSETAEGSGGSEDGAGEDGDGTDTTDAEGVVHTVQAGQGLIEIATIYGVSVAELMSANGLTDQDILRIGQPLIIPGVTARDVAIQQGNIHTVQSGESLLSIALIYGVTVEELQEANELANPDAIFVGQELIIPLQ